MTKYTLRIFDEFTFKISIPEPAASINKVDIDISVCPCNTWKRHEMWNKEMAGLRPMQHSGK